MRWVLANIFLILGFFGLAQDSLYKFPIDYKFREDQFYATIAHQVFVNRPSDIAQNSFSPEIRIGFLRDMPINQSRQLAIAPGLGLSYKNINTSASFSKFNTKDNFGNVVYNKQSINQFLVEFPLELRFRASTPTTHEFFRSHLGVKAAYLFWHQSSFSGFDSFTINNRNDFNSLLWDVYIAVGFNTLNAYFSYGLNPMLKNQENFEGTSINFKRLSFGLMFYIL